jgi:hypothetical protein
MQKFGFLRQPYRLRFAFFQQQPTAAVPKRFAAIGFYFANVGENSRSSDGAVSEVTTRFPKRSAKDGERKRAGAGNFAPVIFQHRFFSGERSCS